MSVTFSIIGNPSYEDAPNFSNGNARVVLDLIGVPYSDELWGTWEGKELDAVIRGATRALNNSRVNFERPEHIEGRVIDCGTTDECVRVRIREVLDLCFRAKKEGGSVTFG